MDFIGNTWKSPGQFINLTKLCGNCFIKTKNRWSPIMGETFFWNLVINPEWARYLHSILLTPFLKERNILFGLPLRETVLQAIFQRKGGDYQSDVEGSSLTLLFYDPQSISWFIIAVLVNIIIIIIIIVITTFILQKK